MHTQMNVCSPTEYLCNRVCMIILVILVLIGAHSDAQVSDNLRNGVGRGDVDGRTIIVTDIAVTDTYIDEDKPLVHFAHSKKLVVGHTEFTGAPVGGGRQDALIRFNLSQIEKPFRVVRAELVLFQESEIGDEPIDLVAYRTYNFWPEEKKWPIPNYNQSLPSSIESINNIRGEKRWDVTSIFSDWMKDPKTWTDYILPENRSLGLVLRESMLGGAPETIQRAFSSREGSNPPCLEIVLEELIENPVNLYVQRVDWIIINQSIQVDLAGSLYRPYRPPIVGGKLAWISVEVQNEVNTVVNGVMAELTVWVKGENPIVYGSSTPGGFSVSNLPSIINFAVWIPNVSQNCKDCLRLDFRLIPPPTVYDWSQNDNVNTIEFDIRHGPRLNLVIYRVGYTGDTWGSPPRRDPRILSRWLTSAFPISSVDLEIRPFTFFPAPHIQIDNGELVSPADAMNSALLSTRETDNPPYGTVYYGMIDDAYLTLQTLWPPPIPDNFFVGTSIIGGFVASGPTGQACCGANWDTDGTYGDWYGAHEIAHAIGRLHPGYCNQAIDDEDGNIALFPNGDIGGTGVDIRTAGHTTPSIYPANSKDLMTYCNTDSMWISAYTYVGIYDALTQIESSQLLAEESTRPKVDLLLVSGSISASTENIKLFPCWHLYREQPLVSAKDSNWSVRLEGADGQILSSVYFEPMKLSDFESDSTMFFSAIVPYITGKSRISIVKDGQSRAAFDATRHTPSVSILGDPFNSSRIDAKSATLKWHASDADGDSLISRVLYSVDDGENWQVIVLPQTSKDANIRFADLPGTNAARIRVEVSDGINVGWADLRQFKVSNKPPTVELYGPGLMQSRMTYLVRAVVHDPEDDAKGHTINIQWILDDEEIAEGQLDLLLQGLPVGSHILILRAQDSNGGITEEKLQLTVEATQ